MNEWLISLPYETLRDARWYLPRMSPKTEELLEESLKNAVPVVRCRDCKYAHMTYDGECKYCQLDIDRGYTDAAYRDGDWFCADGERRESDEE